MADNHLIDEKDVPGNWVDDVSPAANRLRPSAPPIPNAMPQYFTGSMPPKLQHDTSFVGTETASPRIPKFSLMPLGLQANAITNAAIASTASVTPPRTPPATGGGDVTALTGPVEALITGNPAAPTNTINWAWKPEPNNFVFATSSQALSGLEAIGVSNGQGAATYTVSATPTTDASWGFLAAGTSGQTVAAPTWTSVGGGTQVFTKNITGQTLQSVSTTILGDGSITANMMIFNGNLPTTAQHISGGLSVGNTISFPSSVTTGNALFIVMTATRGGGGSIPPFGTTVSDSVGNIYEKVIDQSLQAQLIPGHFYPEVQCAVFICANCIGGTVAVSYSFVGTIQGGDSGGVDCYEFSPIASGTGIPFFQPITTSMLPSIDATKVNTGILSTSVGGLGISIAGLGGPGEVLKKTSAGGNVTVGLVDFADLTGSISVGQIAGGGQPDNILWGDKSWNPLGKIAMINANNNNSSLGPNNLYSIPSGSPGLYRISYSLVASNAGVGDTVFLTVFWNNGFGNQQAQTATLTLTNLGDEVSGDFTFRGNNPSNITYTTTYAATNAGEYGLRIRAEYLG